MFRPVLALVFAVGVVLAAPGFARAAATDCLVFGRQFEEEDVAALILSENIMLALNAVGVCVTARPLPGKRITQALLQGEIDGEFARILSYLDHVGDAAVLVEEPVVRAAGYIVTHDPEITAVMELGTRPLGTLRGFLWQEEAVRAASRFVAANSYEQLAEMFLNGRVEAILIDQYNLERFPELGTRPRTVVAQIDAYIVLHKSKAALSESIAQAVRFYTAAGCVFERYHGGPACGLRNPPIPNN